MFPSAPILPQSAFLSLSPEAGLHLALRAAGVMPGDYVLVPALCTSELAGALRRAEAVPILIDVHPQDWLLDLDLLEQFLMGHTLVNDQDTLVMRRDQKPVCALVAVHLNGVPADLNRLRFIAHRFFIPLIEDACEATGAQYHQQSVGLFGDSGVFSLDNHPYYPGEKGALLLSQRAEALQKLKDDQLLARFPEEYQLVHLGLDQLPALQKARAEHQLIQERIDRFFQGIPDIAWQQVPALAEQACHTMTFTAQRPDELKAWLTEAGITTASFTPPLHRLPAFQHSTYIRIHDHARTLFESAIRIPDAGQKTEEEWAALADLLRRFYGLIG